MSADRRSFRRSFTAARYGDRCEAIVRLGDGSTADCMRAAAVGALCAQHHEMAAGRRDAVSHVRRLLPTLGGSTFYRDKTDRSTWARTICGAPVTDRDVNASALRRSGRPIGRSLRQAGVVCQACLVALDAGTDISPRK